MLRQSALVAALTVPLLLIVFSCGGGEGSPTSTPASTSTPFVTPTRIATATPEVIDGVEVVPLPVGEEAELPHNVALIVETGCFSCDGPPTGLYRVYRDASGRVRVDALFTVDALGLPARAVGQDKEIQQPLEPYIHSYALSSDASQIVVSVCTRGDCAWIDPASPDAQATLYRSLDGGVTWSDFGVLDGSSGVVAIAGDGVVVSNGDPAQAGPRYSLYPSGVPVQTPQAGDNRPLSFPSGDLIWWSKDGRLLRSDGSELLNLGKDVTSVNTWRKNIQLDPSGQRLAVVWWTQGPRQTGQDYLAVGTLDGRITNVFSVPGYAGVGGWVDSGRLIGNAAFSENELGPIGPHIIGYLPALYDLDAGQLHPMMQPFLYPPFQNQRNQIQAVLHGPFARVVNTGSCLNVRADPAMAAPVLACGADGVLLRDAGESREVDGATWRRVVTPAGVEGWASSQFLER